MVYLYELIYYKTISIYKFNVKQYKRAIFYIALIQICCLFYL